MLWNGLAYYGLILCLVPSRVLQEEKLLKPFYICGISTIDFCNFMDNSS